MLGIIFKLLGHGQAPKAPVEKWGIEMEYMLLANAPQKQLNERRMMVMLLRVSQCIAALTLCP